MFNSLQNNNSLDLIIGKMYYSISMKNDDKPVVEIYSDGACSGNPGVGGFGAILRSGGKEKEISGCEAMTTNNRKELLNRDLWERLLQASKPHKIEWMWIKGHNGHPENERCDQLAREEIIRCKKRLAGENT